ncbi:MAG: helix-hairpin-helix domain-containing protein [Xenococcaceae cyanobacterium MO_234.B1]|nr:helix-hairpin-helix domain-containing protein [Xenococcaceae cyanobacterium MO_234.B1]
MKVETVKIKHPDGYSLINKADFDESIHELFEESNQSVPALPARAVEETSTDVSLRTYQADGVSPSVLSSSAEEKKVLKINLNTADKKTLISLPRIGAKTAEEIINARPFGSLEEAIAQFKGLEDLKEVQDLSLEV